MRFQAFPALLVFNTDRKPQGSNTLHEVALLDDVILQDSQDLERDMLSLAEVRYWKKG